MFLQEACSPGVSSSGRLVLFRQRLQSSDFFILLFVNRDTLNPPAAVGAGTMVTSILRVEKLRLREAFVTASEGRVRIQTQLLKGPISSNRVAF